MNYCEYIIIAISEWEIDRKGCGGMKKAGWMALGVFAMITISGCGGVNVNGLVYTKADSKKIVQAVTDDKNMPDADKALFTAAVKSDKKGKYEGKSVGDIIADRKKIEEARAKIQKEMKDAIELTVIGKTQLEQNEDEWRFTPETVLTIRTTNHSQKDIRAFKGVLHMEDLFGEGISDAQYTDSDEIAAGETRELEITMSANPSDPTDMKIYNTPLENMKMTWETDAIIYKDKTMVGDVKYLKVPGYTVKDPLAGK